MIENWKLYFYFCKRLSYGQFLCRNRRDVFSKSYLNAELLGGTRCNLLESISRERESMLNGEFLKGAGLCQGRIFNKSYRIHVEFDHWNSRLNMPMYSANRMRWKQRVNRGRVEVLFVRKNFWKQSEKMSLVYIARTNYEGKIEMYCHFAISPFAVSPFRV